MKFILNYETSLKNGLYIDYYFKNIVFYLYKNIINNNFIYLIDKFLAEKLFYKIKFFFNNFFFVINLLKSLNFNQFLKLFIVLSIQIIIIIIL